jgi:DNA polymerase (family 10)
MTAVAQLDRRAVAHALEQIAELLELKGESGFRSRSFRTAARAVRALALDLATALAEGSMRDIRGVGPATLQVVTELAGTGRSTLLEELREQVPPGLVEMLRIPGLGVARIRQIHDLLDIDSVPDLEAAALDGRLATLPRFGVRTAENICDGIRFLRRARTFRLAHHAADEARVLAEMLARLPDVLAVHPAGEVRRLCEVVESLVMVVVSNLPPAGLLGRLRQLPGVDEVLEADERVVTVRFAGGTAARLMATPPANAGAVLVHATGNDAHVRLLEARAAAMGMSLTGAALWRGSTFVPTPDEAALYAALDLPWIPPEWREGIDELDAAKGGVEPMLERGQLRGLLHCHTQYSDGTGTVRDLAEACEALGYEYVGITDHSGAAAYAGGLTADSLLHQADQMDALNASGTGIRVLKGVEADILQDGSLEYPPAVLDRLDFVIASVHSRFNLDRAAMTARIVAAMQNPYVTIIGHPTGRLLLQREPYDLDLDTLLATAADRGVALEINADPHRLDLGWRHLTRARERGATVSIGADAHSVAGLENVSWGVGMARKARIAPSQVLNTRTAADLLAFARARH